MPERSWTVGRAPDCDIVVNNPAVSSHHCRLTLAGQGLSLEDLKSANGTYVNGQRVAGVVPVFSEDIVTLGKTIPFPWPDEAASGAKLMRPTEIGNINTPRSGGKHGPGIVTIGRAADNDVRLDYPTVSGHHARLVTEKGETFIEDLGSTNGTSLGHPDKRITREKIVPSDVVFFGSLRVPASRLFGGNLSLGLKGHETVSFTKQTVIFGRHPDCDKVLSIPSVSARHARLTRSPAGFQIEDLGSSNGTYVNGRRITEPTAVKIGDMIALGTYTFKLDDEGNLQQSNLQGNVTLEVRGITVDVPGKRLLEDVSLTIYPSEFVGLMGPSGAGKTTLMNALNGYTPPSSGEVLINGESLYDDYDRFAPFIGYVPQDDIMHKDLTVGEALYFTARLRLPSDFTDEEIHQRIDNILKQLELEGAKNVLIGSPEKKGISGGQRKRVNLAMELLSDPLVLFLDEPTSGLSSRDAFNVMQLLRRLADSGKTILLTIHQPSLDVFRLMDSLCLVSKDTNSADPGRLVYFGPNYPDAVTFFNPQGVGNAYEGVEPPEIAIQEGRQHRRVPAREGVDPPPDEIFNGLDRNGTTAEWRTRYLESRYYKEYVVERAGKPTASKKLEADPSRGGSLDIGQFWTLLRRTTRIKASDLVNTSILLVQAPIVALLAVMLFGKTLTEEVKTADESAVVGNALVGLLFFASLAAFFFGCFNSVREIVGEWSIYRRERMVFLRIVPYLASKWVVLGAFCVVQSAILLAVIHWLCRLKGPWGAMYVLLLLNGLVGMGIGLLISAVAKNSERAMGLVVLVVLLMVLFGGALMPLHRTASIGQAASMTMAQRWAFEGLLVMEVENGGEDRKMIASKIPGAPAPGDMAEKHFPKDDHRLGPMTAFTALLVMLVVVIVTPGVVLRLRDIH